MLTLFVQVLIYVLCLHNYISHSYSYIRTNHCHTYIRYTTIHIIKEHLFYNNY